MIKKISIFFFLLTLLINAGPLFASGFKNFDLSARAATLGGAFVARVDDASAVYYNPAGIAFLDGLRIKSNMLYFSLVNEASYEGAVAPIKNALGQLRGSYYFTWRLLDNITFGLGGFVPYVMDTGWPGDWQGHTINVTSRLNSYYIRPALALRITDSLSIGAGLDIVFSNVEWAHNLIFLPRQNAPNTESRVQSIFKVKGNGIGFASGFLFKANNKLSIGGKYQHRVKVNLEGLNDFKPPIRSYDTYYVSGPSGLVLLSQVLSVFYRSQNVTSSITMPSEVLLGFMYVVSEKLTLQMDLQWTEWSVVDKWEFVSENSNEDLSPKFIEDYGDFYGVAPDYSIQSAELNWKDSWSLMLGVEFFLSKVSSLRAGYTNQQSSVENNALDPIQPALGRSIFSFGFGYEGPLFSPTDGAQIAELSFDVYFQYILSAGKTSTLTELPVSYDADRWIVGLGFGINF